MSVTSTQPRPYTLDDLLSLPDSADRCEILQGELIVSPPPSFQHQDILQAIWAILLAAVSATTGGKVIPAPLGVELTPSDIVQPDLVFLSTSKRSLIAAGVVKGQPDLVVEILSPSTQGYDRVRKRALYARSGVPEYWIVDPARRSIEVYELAGDEYRPNEQDDGLVRSTVIPGVEIDPVALFDSIWWSE